jgi:DNA polymerase elongation subunit (family B)
VAALPPAEPRFVNGFVDGADLVLLYRDEGGRLMQRRRKAEWSSFHREADMKPEHWRDLRKSQFVLGMATEGVWVRVRWQAPEWRRLAHYGTRDSKPEAWQTYFKEQALPHFEADVSEVRRFFSETGAQVARPRRAYLDIETDSRVPPAIARAGKARVLCWSLVDEQERLVGQGVLEADADAAEAQLLEALWKSAEPYDQLVAWFGDGFDFPIIRKRTQLVGARAKDFRRWLYMDQMELYERMNRQVAESGEEKTSLALQRVAEEVLGYGKLDFDATNTYAAWAAGGESRARLVEYNERDTKLLPAIERKRGHLATNDVICEIGRLFADTSSINPTEYVDGFMLRMGVERGIRFPTRARYEGDETRKKFAGAYVMEPKTRGIAKNIHVLDFSGMYPSIIQTWNMSAETRRDVPINGPIPEGCCRSPSTGVGFATSPSGILPDALRELGERRKHWTQLQASLPPGSPDWHAARRMSDGYKVIRNTFYGVVGSPFSRFFERSIAESVTQNGVWLIRQTVHEAEKRGMRVVYADTDSAFVERTTRHQFAELVAYCNAEVYPRAVASVGCASNAIEIAYEKEFERIVFVSAKRYTGALRQYKWTTNCVEGCDGSVSLKAMACAKCGRKFEDATLPAPRGKPEIKGLEYKRGDTLLLARQLQFAVVRGLMVDRCEEPERFLPTIERVRDHVLLDDLRIGEIVLSQSINRSIDPKAKDGYKTRAKKGGGETAAPAHVQVARVLKERGAHVEGMRIEYFVVDSTATPMVVAPAEDWGTIHQQCDRYYLWEQRIWPPTQRLLEAAFPDADWSGYARVRPKAPKVARSVEEETKLRPRAKKVATEQESLFAALERPAPSLPPVQVRGVH